MIYSPRFSEALEYAAQTHQTQLRKGTQIPYIGHLLGVASIVIDAGATEDEAIAALLHDAPEDQGGHARLSDIRDRFGESVADIIEGCSDPLDKAGKAEHPWDVRKAAYLEHLRTCADKSVYLVSAADKLHNARATLADVRADGASVWARFNAGRNATLENYKALIAVYRQGPPDVRRDRIVKELASVIAQLCEDPSSSEPSA
jgi:(p)ppGpp synthase/HD superfamily hydrolase